MRGCVSRSGIVLAAGVVGLFLSVRGARADLSVTSSLEVRYETVGAGAVTTGAGGIVTSWNDQSGTADNATLGAWADYPLLVSDATPTGADALKFDGDDDYLDTGSISALATQTTTWFIVFKVDAFPPQDTWQTQVGTPLRTDTSVNKWTWAPSCGRSP